MCKNDAFMTSNYRGVVIMQTLSACFTGHRASKIPYSDTSIEHEKLENVLKEQIIELIWLGVSEFYTGGQNGIDELTALMVLYVAEEIGTTANLHLVLPYKGVEKHYNLIQKEHFEHIKRQASTVTILHDKYTSGCFRARNSYMVDRSDFLIAVQMLGDSSSGTQMTINMAMEKGIEVRVIDPISYYIKTIKPK